MILLPFAFAYNIWNPICSPSGRNETASQERLMYFEAKGWFPGNEMLVCHTRRQCTEFQKTVGIGFAETSEGRFQKCRGKWYAPEMKRLYLDCYFSIAKKAGFFCSIGDPFCIEPQSGKVLWNTHFDPRRPRRLVDPQLKLPQENFLPEEEFYINQLSLSSETRWTGYKNVEPGTVWIDAQQSKSSSER